MTAPVVGEVSVEVLGSAKALAKSIRAELESSLKSLDVGKLLRESLGKEPIKVPLTPDFDGKDLPKNLPGRAPKVPVEVDPVFDQFLAQVKRDTAGLAREVNAKIPVEGDTAGLRADLAGQLQEIARQVRLQIPAEPGDRAAFQSRLQAQLAEVGRQVQAHVGVDADTSGIPAKVRATSVPKLPVTVDPLLAAFQAQIRRELAGLARTVNTEIPVGADTSRLRAELGGQLAAIERELKAQVPTEPGARGEYEAKLRALVDEASARVKAHVKVDVDKSSGPDFGGLVGLVSGLVPSFGGFQALVSGIGNGIAGLGSKIGQFAASAGEGGSELAASIGEAAGPVGAIVGALAAAQTAVIALGGVATVLVPAFTAAAGAAAAIPAALVGVGAAFGTLDLGFKGIAEAFKPKAAAAGAAAGQAAAQQARQVAAAGRQVEAARRGIAAANRGYEASERSLAAAERGVVTAHRNLVDAEQAVAEAQKKAQQAQLAVNKARHDAADDLVDLNLQLKGSKLSEQEAALAVTDALRALNEAKLGGNIPEIQAADLAYQRAQLTVQQTTQSTKELQDQTDDANKKGVEGSDKVQAALQEQASAVDGVKKAHEGVLDAQNGVLDAADSLKSAQDGVVSAQDGIKSASDGLKSALDSLAQSQQKVGGGAAAMAKQVIKLAPSAQDFVTAVKGLKPAFDGLRLDVQQRLFQGLDTTVTNLGQGWIPALKVTLGSYASTFNGFFKNLGTSLSQPKFITDIQAGAEGARQGMSKIFNAITKDLIPAFGDLSTAAAPFLSKLGGKIAGFVTHFSKLVEDGQKSGKLQTFFDKASTALDQISRTGKLSLQIVGDIVAIIIGAQTGSKGKPGKAPIDQFNDTLQKIHNWLNDPNNQKKVDHLIDSVETAFTDFGELAKKVDKAIGDVNPGGSDAADSVGNLIGRALISGLIAGAGLAIRDLATSWIFYFTPAGPLIQPVLTALGIRSPSTVFAEIGHNLIQGLINGIKDFFGGLASTAGSIASTVIGAVGDAGGWLYSKGKDAVGGLMAGINAAFPALGGTTAQAKPVAQAAVSAANTWLVAHGKAAIGGMQSGIASQQGALKTTAAGSKGTVQGANASSGTWLNAHGKNAVIGLQNGMIAQSPALQGTSSSLRSRVLNGLTDAFTLLNNAGKNLVSGLINGIQSSMGTLGTYLGQVGSFIQAHKGPPEKDRVLLFGAGQLIMGGLIGGIGSQKQALSDQLGDVTAMVEDAATGASFAGLGSHADAAITASLQASSQQKITVGWERNATGDQLLDALARHINLRHNGDVQAALSRS